MRPDNMVKVFAEWLPRGIFFIWARQEGLDNLFLTPLNMARELSFRLLAWHRPSYYGTFIDTMQHENRFGIVLPPRTALDFFTEPLQAENLNWQWSEEILKLRQAAPAVKEALVKGQYKPDFDSWQAGKTGWKLDRPGDPVFSTLPYLEEWVSNIINEMIKEDPKAGQLWEKLAQNYPVLQPGAPRSSYFIDEYDWLEATGWKQDATPFSTCLQLAEPEEDDAPWKLRLLLQDKKNPTRQTEWQPAAAEDSLPADWAEHRAKIDRDIKKIMDLYPELQDHSNPEENEDRNTCLRRELSEDEAWAFLNTGSLELAKAGFTVWLPKWWEEVQKLKPALKVKTRSSVGSWGEGWLSADRLVKFDWKVAIGDKELSEDEFRQLARKKQRLVQIKGEWMQLDPSFLLKVQKMMKKRKDLSLAEVLQLHLLSGTAEDGPEPGESEEDTVRMEVELNEQLTQMMDQLTHLFTLTIEDTPPSFQGKLRNYQRIGTSWLLFLRRFGLGGCLADDMGLGKTIQWIAYLLKVKEEENPATPALLICPTSVLGNWQKELARFAPGLKVYLHYGPQRKKGEAFLPSIEGADLVITSYTLAHMDEEDLCSVDWNCICLDEAQNIKNAYTKQSISVHRLKGRHRIALTGTPMENRLTELWSIMDFLNPRYLGSLREFNRRFVTVIERQRNEQDIQRVQRLIHPFLLRRVKSDPSIELDLPEKQELKEYVPLTVEQASLYESTLRNMFERLEEATGIARRGLILSTLTKLKLLCNHPALLLKENKPTKVKARSNKIMRLLEMVEKLRQEGNKCLIFTQFVGMGHMLQKILQKELGENVFFLHGGTPKGQRDKMIATFQNQDLPDHEASHVFILSLKAGGLGLNLTAANHVFHFDRWWNPAVENQATDRSHRIGQRQHVQVHKFISLGTLEERIDEMIEHKQDLNEKIVGGGETWITELSTRELKDIFALRKEWVS